MVWWVAGEYADGSFKNHELHVFTLNISLDLRVILVFALMEAGREDRACHGKRGHRLLLRINHVHVVRGGC